MSQRVERVDALLREEIGKLLAKEVQDPRIGFVTVTEVEASPDLRHARVWVSVIGSPDEQRTAVRALGRAMPYVRHELGARLRLKRIPELHVELDDSMSRATRVLRILDELERGENPESVPPDEQLPTPVRRLPRDGDAPEPADTREAADVPEAGGPGPAGQGPDPAAAAPHEPHPRPPAESAERDRDRNAGSRRRQRRATGRGSRGQGRHAR